MLGGQGTHQASAWEGQSENREIVSIRSDDGQNEGKGAWHIKSSAALQSGDF